MESLAIARYRGYVEQSPPDENASIRAVLISAVAAFVRAARELPEVRRIALIGSLTTDKPDPADADVLVTIADGAALASLSSLGRRLKGAAQQRNRGADIFLCSTDHRYLGRTCTYRVCHPRASCAGQQCRPGSHLKDDLHVVTLPADLIRHPPIELWPEQRTRIQVPADVARLLLDA